jgi:hypothetical protein
MPVISAFRWLKQDCEFKASLGCIARPCLKKVNKRNKSIRGNLYWLVELRFWIKCRLSLGCRNLFSKYKLTTYKAYILEQEDKWFLGIIKLLLLLFTLLTSERFQIVRILLGWNDTDRNISEKIISIIK